MYYIAFHKYANQGFYKNEFEELTFPNNQAGGPPPFYWQVEMGYSIDVTMLFGMGHGGLMVIQHLIFWGMIKTVEKVKPLIKASMAVPPKQSSDI